jgi:hypothetical protein
MHQAIDLEADTAFKYNRNIASLSNMAKNVQC